MKAKRISVALLALTVLGATACSNNKQEQASPATTGSGKQAASAPAPVTLKGMLFGDQPKDMQVVFDEFEKRTKDTLNTKLNIQWNPISDHKQKVKLMMAAGEETDFVFEAEFMNLKELVPQGAYAQLDKYFNNDAYPGLKKAFPKEYIESNKRYDGHLYTIPFTQYFYDIDAVFLRKDLREKYGLPPIKSYDDLQKFYDKVLENEKGLTPLAVRGVKGFQNLLQGENPVLPNVLQSGTSIIKLSDDLKKVESIVGIGDPASEWAKLPAPYNNPHTAFPYLDKWAEWSKYLEKDVVSQKDEVGYFMSGKAASVYRNLSNYSQDRKKLKDTIPGADLEMFVFKTPVREMKPKAIGVDYRANNNIAIPANSKNIDRTMKFFDWLFSSRENHDLIEYGIPGKHWEAVGDGQIKLLDEAKNYNFPGYEFTWNPTMIRLSSDLDENVRKYYEYSAKSDTYYAPTMGQFKFDNSLVKSETAKPAGSRSYAE
jgi:putative aldouronate transport system substrate-binding protein